MDFARVYLFVFIEILNVGLEFSFLDNLKAVKGGDINGRNRRRQEESLCAYL